MEVQEEGMKQCDRCGRTLPINEMADEGMCKNCHEELDNELFNQLGRRNK